MVTISEVNSKKELINFLEFPEELYQDNKVWVKPIISSQLKFFSSKNPIWEYTPKKLFVAKENNKTVGRIGIFINKRYINFSKEKAAYFGFFESANSKEVANKLFQSAESFAKEKGIKTIRGPINASTLYETGLLIKGFHLSPKPSMPYSPPYYKKLISRSGFKKAMDLYAFTIDLNSIPYSRLLSLGAAVLLITTLANIPFIKTSSIGQLTGASIAKINAIFPAWILLIIIPAILATIFLIKSLPSSTENIEEEIRLRSFDKSNHNQEIKHLKNIVNKAMTQTKHYQYFPVGIKEFLFLSEDLKSIIDPDLIWFVEHKKKPSGVCVTYKDFNLVLKNFKGKMGLKEKIRFLIEYPKVKHSRLEIISIHPDLHHSGLGKRLAAQVIKKLKDKGFTKLEYSWVLETNHKSNRLARYFGGKIYKKYRIFEKDIIPKTSS